MTPPAASTRSGRGAAAVLLGAGLLLAGPTPPALRAQGVPPAEACVGCHLELDEPDLAAPARLFAGDIHADRGFTCLDCHGEPGPGFLAAPRGVELLDLCGSCHSDARFMRDFNPSLRVDQVTEYLTSVHGTLLLEEGDREVATCVSCHPAHDTRPPSDPESTVHPLNVAETCGRCHADPDLMASRGHADDELDEYLSSVHALNLYEEGDLSSPTCNDCHGNHGAAPPGVASVRNVCGQCHTRMAELLSASGHGEALDSLGLPGCATCHDNHAIRILNDEDLPLIADSVCARCHDPDTEEYRSAGRMMTLIDSLEAERRRAGALLDEAHNLGMEVSEALFELDGVGNALTRARSAIHSFTADSVRQEMEAGLAITEAARERGLEALDEHRFRRVGLAASTGVILLLIVSLLLRLRRIESRGGGPRPPDRPIPER